ncbi:MAG: lytic murein transglycosylase [Caulobacterales bacterium]|nr:lytic murein transglycosylase [Caulobacterales bacterium]MCA0371315.1 lytic murein transglycosylase [Pseudomonadota bacterium]
MAKFSKPNFKIKLFIFTLCIFPINTKISYAQNIENSAFKKCVINAAHSAIAKGANSEKAMFAIKDIYAPNDEIIALSKVQPETNMKIWDYLAFAIDDERASDGINAINQYNVFLNDLENKTGVDKATIIGVWGMETNYGNIVGKRNIIDALSTLGCTKNRRAKYFKSELIAAIKIEASGHVPHDKFVGSWAGAFGQTQFMPSSFLRLAMDGNNDGIKNIIEEPKDALASTANFLAKSGWISGQEWGFEIIPQNYKSPSSRTYKKPISYWKSHNFMRADGKELPQYGNFGLVKPAGQNGPWFLVGKNFDAVYSYNPAISYALAVNLISDRIKGSKGIYGQWPTDDLGLSRAQKREIQIILSKNGYDIGPIDGIIGKKAIQAIEQFFKDRNLDYNGRIGTKTYIIILKYS